jgi:hypothetical protein
MNRLARVAALALLLAPAAAAAQKVDRTVRRFDRRGVIVRLDSNVQGSVDVSRFKLFDLTTGDQVALSGSRDVSAETCNSNPDNRLCLPLASGELDDTHGYLLWMDAFRTTKGKVSAQSVSLGPVKGKIEKEDNPVDSAKVVQFITASYPREFRAPATVRPQIRVNGQPTAYDATSVAELPPCYRPGGYTFTCKLFRQLKNGDVVTFRLVDARDTTRVVDDSFGSFTVARQPPEKEADAGLRLTTAYSRQNGGQKGSIELLVRQCRLATGVQICPEVRFGGLDQALEGWIRPYVNLLLSTEDDGRYDLGLQFQSYLYDVPVFRMVDFRVTPRRESDQKGTLSHWMYVDAEARFYLRGLQSGGILGGFYSLVPRVGYERGVTGTEPDAPRIEAADPERFKAGALLAVNWPKDRLTFLRSGGTLSADFTAYSVHRDPSYTRPPGRWLQNITAKAVFNVRPNAGISLTRRSGRQPPLFQHQNTFELGFTFLQ